MEQGHTKKGNRKMGKKEETIDGSEGGGRVELGLGEKTWRSCGL